MTVRHDNLCVIVQQDPENNIPRHLQLKYCWCNCANCWHAEGFVASQKKLTEEQRATQQRTPKGRCICRACPCHELFPTPLAMPAAPRVSRQ